MIHISFLHPLTRKQFWSKPLVRLTVLGLALWGIFISLLVIGEAHRGELIGWGSIIPLAIFLFDIFFGLLIPRVRVRPRPFLAYLTRALLIIAVSWLPAGALMFLFTHETGAAMQMALYHVFFQLIVTLPLAWILYGYQHRRDKEVVELKKELGQTHAGFDFLRSQINPHFLFNALNTLYGTALVEGSERTAEGILMLSDMMRFMLRENMEERIRLSREIDYLNNYISLQRLRTDANERVRVEAVIEAPEQEFTIAPMLLIPFVENAFKHGISFRHDSRIMIQLEIKNDILYFDVHNAKAARPEHDPERGKSGIGLNNVRQRLQLIYPDRHELLIRETAQDFFVHLVIRLT